MSGNLEACETVKNQAVLTENAGIDRARLDCQIQNVQVGKNAAPLPDAPGATLLSSSADSTPPLEGSAAEPAALSRAGVTPPHGRNLETGFLDRHHLWLTTGFFSQHFTANNHFNQVNTGVGAELQLTKHQTVTVGEYYNSIRQHSFYAADEIRWQVKNSPIKVGAGFGIVSGYRTSFPIVPLALPMVSVEFNKQKHPHLSHMGADFVVIPPVGDKQTGTPTVAAVRMKFAWGAR